MGIDSETLGKILGLGFPRGRGQSEFRRKLKFRVSFKADVSDAERQQGTSFTYHDLASARRCYRDLLLAFYRCKRIGCFAICLNHFNSKKWGDPIHIESIEDSQ